MICIYQRWTLIVKQGKVSDKGVKELLVDIKSRGGAPYEETADYARVNTGDEVGLHLTGKHSGCW